MAVVRKKQDDTNLKILRELVTSGSGGNRQCFDCGQKGPTYVNMTIGSFVCTRCSGVLRGLTPPHRVKSISVATFTPDELEFLKLHGNDICAKTWLGLWDPKRIVHQDQRELMIDKYERKRYYLEPASPLKSLTNATKVSSLSSSNNSISTNGSSSIPNNNHNNSSTSSNKSSTDNSLKSVTLTPPTSLHLNSNGIVNNSRTNNNRQIRYNFKTDENSNKSGSLVNGVGNGTSSNPMSATNKRNLNVATNSGDPQGFTPDSEFVADFSTANIFNAAAQSTPNGIKHHLPASMTNGFQNSGFLNGTIANQNGLEGNSSANENFADFDHAPIYNAAAAYQNSYSDDFATISNNNYFSANMNKNTLNSAVQNFNNFSSAMNNNFYNLGDQSNLSNNSTLTPCNNATLGNLQWNVWQQFQWPSFFANSEPNQNRWSLPMSNAASNVYSSRATTNANSAVSSTPPADRYAALKDLDEQLRENKAATETTFSSNVQAQQSTANPFKMNPPAQPQPAMNPFQASYNQSNSMFGAQSQNNPANAFSGTNATFNVQQISNFNGYSTQSSLLTNGSNSSGVAYGPQPITAGNAGSNMKNPFATSSLNSNNPFL